MKINVNTNHDERTIGNLQSGDIFVMDEKGYPYMVTDNDYPNRTADKCLCVYLCNGCLYTFENSETVVAVKNVELNYDL